MHLNWCVSLHTETQLGDKLLKINDRTVREVLCLSCCGEGNVPHHA